jgi:hypothetical protein
MMIVTILNLASQVIKFSKGSFKGLTGTSFLFVDVINPVTSAI